MAPGAWATTWLRLGGVHASIVLVLALTLTGCSGTPPMPAIPPQVAPSPTVITSAEPPLVAIPPSADLPVVAYWPSPAGFPTDPTPLSTARLTEGLRPTGRIA